MKGESRRVISMEFELVGGGKFPAKCSAVMERKDHHVSITPTAGNKWRVSSAVSKQLLGSEKVERCIRLIPAYGSSSSPGIRQ